MSAPVTKEHTRKSFNFPKSSAKHAAEGAQPVAAPEPAAKAVAEAAPAVRKEAKAKRPAAAEAAPAPRKAAKARRAAPVEAAPEVKKAAKAKRSASAEAAPVVKKTAKAKSPAAVGAPAAGRKAAKPKRSATAEAAPASTPEARKAKPPKKEKVVRDSFTMPKSDYDRIASLKQKCLEAGVSVKKSELLRAGLIMLESAAPQRLLAAVSSLETVKTGRPAKS
ncbi:hypothetical protein [Paraburkholderia fungorum]|uniref:hypothetical protein n=1 Tax=Paraburkholderia fungorum TaxID=134537 RepID=UPI0015B7399D|nr:hypothetical protein C9419_29640 [Paraburkholderia fungorum]